VSTTFGVETPLGSYVDEDGLEYEKVAFRTNGGGIYFTNPLASLLPDETEVVALDNTPQGIYTIGDIKREINDHNMLVERRSD